MPFDCINCEMTLQSYENVIYTMAIELSSEVVEQLTDAVHPFKTANKSGSINTPIGLDTGVVAEVSVSSVDLKHHPPGYEYDGLHLIDILIEGVNSNDWIDPVVEFLRSELDLDLNKYNIESFDELGTIQTVEQAEGTGSSISLLIPSEVLYGDDSVTYEMEFKSGKTESIIVPDSYCREKDNEEILQGIELFWWDTLNDEDKISYLKPDGNGPLHWIETIERKEE